MALLATATLGLSGLTAAGPVQAATATPLCSTASTAEVGKASGTGVWAGETWGGIPTGWVTSNDMYACAPNSYDSGWTVYYGLDRIKMTYTSEVVADYGNGKRGYRLYNGYRERRSLPGGAGHLVGTLNWKLAIPVGPDKTTIATGDKSGTQSFQRVTGPDGRTLWCGTMRSDHEVRLWGTVVGAVIIRQYLCRGDGPTVVLSDGRGNPPPQATWEWQPLNPLAPLLGVSVSSLTGGYEAASGQVQGGWRVNGTLTLSPFNSPFPATTGLISDLFDYAIIPVP